MTCKDCYHNEICPVWDEGNDKPYKDGYRGFCNNYDMFKDKSRIIELPCKVTNGFKEKLTKYCHERCFDEL